MSGDKTFNGFALLDAKRTKLMFGGPDSQLAVTVALQDAVSLHTALSGAIYEAALPGYVQNQDERAREFEAIRNVRSLGE